MYSCLQPWLSKVPFSALHSIFMKNFAVYFYYLFFIRAKRKRVKREVTGARLIPARWCLQLQKPSSDRLKVGTSSSASVYIQWLYT